MINQKLVARMLHDHCTLDIANNGAEAVDALKARPSRYDLIFMDINVRASRACHRMPLVSVAVCSALMC